LIGKLVGKLVGKFCAALTPGHPPIVANQNLPTESVLCCSATPPAPPENHERWFNDALPDLLRYGRNPLPQFTKSSLKQMVKNHPDAPKHFSIRLSEETMELVSAIQQFRQRSNQPLTLGAIVESAIQCHYARLVNEGAIEEDDVL
jgi:hypothetical protein